MNTLKNLICSLSLALFSTVTMAAAAQVSPAPCKLDGPGSIFINSKAQLTLTTDTTITAISFSPAVSTSKKVSGKNWIYSGTVQPKATTQYTATLTNKAGKVSCSIRVEVKAYPKPFCQLTPQENTLYKGSSSTLTLSAENASKITLKPSAQLISRVGKISQYKVTPNSNIQYTATVSGDGGSSTCTTNIQVKPIPHALCELSLSSSVVAPSELVQVVLKTDGFAKQARTLPMVNFSKSIENGFVYYRGTVRPSVSTTFKGQVSGAAGLSTCQASVSVVKPKVVVLENSAKNTVASVIVSQQTAPVTQSVIAVTPPSSSPAPILIAQQTVPATQAITQPVSTPVANDPIPLIPVQTSPIIPVAPTMPAAICGDNIVEDPEECDEGTNNGKDIAGCSIACTSKVASYCGDGVKNSNEICDDAYLNGTMGYCNLSCTGPTIPICGNAITEETEACDDGNNENGDGCSKECELEECQEVTEETCSPPEEPEVSSPTEEQLECINREFTAYEITHPEVNFPIDGCSIRAVALADLVRQNCGVETEQLWAYGVLKPCGNVSWKMHTVPTFRDANNALWILDPAMASKPVTYDTWAGLCTKKGGRLDRSYLRVCAKPNPQDKYTQQVECRYRAYGTLASAYEECNKDWRTAASCRAGALSTCRNADQACTKQGISPVDSKYSSIISCEAVPAGGYK